MKNLIRIFSCAFFLAILPSISYAQVTSTNKIVVDEPAPTLAVAQGYVYKYYEGASAGVILTGTSCTGTVSPYTCTFTFPAFTPGAHTISVTATDTSITPNLESGKSNNITFTFVMIPATPLNGRTQ